ncbi:hypothetical protein ACF0H5_002085 [Mactra antiquata]
MNRERKQGVCYRQPINAKNIAAVQKRFEEDMKVREKAKTVFNGTIKAEESSTTESDTNTELEYKFLYSLSDNENGDIYSYEFDTFPVHKYSLQEKTEAVSGITGGEKRARSAVASSRKANMDTMQVRPYSASHCQMTAKSKVSISTVSSSNKGSEKRTTFLPVDELGGIYKRQESAVSKVSSKRSEVRDLSRKKKSVTYDPALDKASAFIHGGDKNFSRANTTLTPMKYGMKHLQMSYTETNLETNQSVIFLDLLKTSYQRSQIRNAYIEHIERRLATKRNNPLYSTSYYDNKNIQDPFYRNSKKTARSAAQKKIERKKKIKQMTDEIHTGYVPTRLTMKIADHEEVEDIGKKCRYLRNTSTPEV